MVSFDLNNSCVASLCNADVQYYEILNSIMNNGWLAPNRTEYKAKKVIQKSMHFDLGADSLPLLKSKKVAWKTAILEMLWIYQRQSNVVQDLRDMSKAAFGKETSIWNGWEGEDGTIGKAYGYQIKNFKQIDNLIKTLKEDPQDRSMMLNLWNWSDAPEMNLKPCCFLTMWDVTDGRLSCTLVQRSCDMALGVPFNMVQFAALQIAIAWATGLKLGVFYHFLQNAHVYENQFDAVKQQIQDIKSLIKMDNIEGISREDLEKIIRSKPKLTIDKNYKQYNEISVEEALERFYSLELKDFILTDYYSLPKRDMGEVAGTIKR